MSFSSSLFLFIFLPVAFLLFCIMPKKARKVYLIGISILFYAIESLRALPILIFSIIINYSIGFGINKCKKRKIPLILGIAFNVFLLFIYKYANFAIASINSTFSANMQTLNLLVPLGISFFTFQEISYLVDIYKDKINFDKNIINFSLYICFFPRIISGPIVRYEEFQESIINFSKPTFEKLYLSIKRICLGLGKILILSNVMRTIWNNISTIASNGDVSVLTAWFGIICYSFYIYMDFSGYTDVAIGVGNLFGIKLPENFDYPYYATSISDFWRRWHITLSRWFKDYIYIPLGGSKKGNVYIHILIVFLLTGVWHGASWNFIFWGVYHGIWRMMERAIQDKKLYNEIPKVIKRIVTYIIVIIGWVLFASNGFKSALEYYKYMFGIHSIEQVQYGFSYFFNLYNVFFLVVCIFVSLPLKNKLYEKIKNQNLKEIMSGICCLLILIISIIFLVNGSYSPPIYAQF